MSNSLRLRGKKIGRDTIGINYTRSLEPAQVGVGNLGLSSQITAVTGVLVAAAMAFSSGLW